MSLAFDDRSVIFEVVQEYMGVTELDLFGTGRNKDVVLARRIIVRLARRLTTASFPEIARWFGPHREHSTFIALSQKANSMYLEGTESDMVAGVPFKTYYDTIEFLVATRLRERRRFTHVASASRRDAKLGEMPTKINLDDIFILVASYYSLGFGGLVGKSNSKTYALARGIGCKLAREFTTHTTTTLAEYLGGRDHSCVCNAIRTVTACIESMPKIADDYNTLRYYLTTTEERVSRSA